jgi:predicted nucleic acid-binding protein
VGDVVIDTDVASVLQKGRAPAWVNRQVAGHRVWLTFVTVAELWKWAETRNWGTANRDLLDAWLTNRPVIPPTTR